jgi:hypothetical protein
MPDVEEFLAKFGKDQVPERMWKQLAALKKRLGC